jgi:hypothetical protein
MQLNILLTSSAAFWQHIVNHTIEIGMKAPTRYWLHLSCKAEMDHSQQLHALES